MFHNYNDRGFGQFELLSLVPSLVSGAFSVGGALIQSSAAKSVAKSQQETQLSIAQMGTEVQKRWQELELQKIQVAQAALQPTKVTETVMSAPGIQSSTAGILPESIFGIPTLYLAAGVGLLFFLSRRKKGKKVRGGVK